MRMLPLFLLFAVACDEGTDKDTVDDTGGDTYDTEDTEDTTKDTPTAETGDTDTGGTTGTTGDTGTAVVVNLLANEGFENTVVDPTAIDGTVIGGTFPADWAWFPFGSTNWPAAVTGEGIYGSTTGATFTAQTGTGGLKMFGQFNGGENITSVFQQYDIAASGYKAGDSFTMSASVWSSGEDKIGGSNEAYVFVKFFNADFSNQYGESAQSAVFNNASPSDTWTVLSATGTIPAGAAIMQAVIEYRQCPGLKPGGGCYDGGSVYWDDASFVQN